MARPAKIQTTQLRYAQEPPAADTVTPAPPSDEELRARIAGQLHVDLARHFSYPLMARRKGWEGRVLLDFHIEPDGAINTIRVSQSSGYRALDRSAIKSLTKVQRLKNAATWLDGRELDMQVPIIYRLHED